MIEAVIAESLKGNYRDELDFPDGIGFYYQQKNCKCTIDDTNTKKNQVTKMIHWQFHTIFEVEQRAIQLQYMRVSGFFFSTNIQFIIC